MQLGVAGRVKELIEDAEAFARAAEGEFGEAVVKGDRILVRDAAEKACNAVVQATNALILALAGKMPMSHYERRVMLRELEKRHPVVRDLGLRDRYMARYKILHGEAFYEGVVDIEELKVELEKVRQYVEDVKKVVGAYTAGN
ncbi:hypothetical protein ODS41_07405 [Pyrobaculum sp. 3827-6]|uniref:hypothetical protein n=1 Tax=Pyrobaculum sp. 3827-6 TaxID=2983604 RepID=UPI0021D95387|nr:hypothetical protein [Pyrobaculum sp. 3827-6]MCU7787739.1 hypothetical protein [Pyrobaculum sp. 3827-6]